MNEWWLVDRDFVANEHDERPKIPTHNNLKPATGNLSQFHLMPANDRVVLVMENWWITTEV